MPVAQRGHQLGNVLAAVNLPPQTWIADNHGGGTALAVVIAPVLVITVLLTAIGSQEAAAAAPEDEADREGRFGRGADVRVSGRRRSPAP